jgi:GntR family transcriptional regulator
MDVLPDLPDDDGTPLYMRIAAVVRAAIESGQLDPGDRVPGENELMRRYNVHRVTARDALGLLRNSGLIETVPKVGTFVRRFQPIYRFGSRRLRRERWTSGHTIQTAELGGRALETDMLEVDAHVLADEHVAELLEVALGAPLVRRHRRYSVDGKPVQIAVSHLPVSIVGGTQIAEPDTGPGGTYARLEELGHGPVRWVEELAVRMPGPEQARLLQLGPGMPIVVMTRVAYTAKDLPIELNQMTFDASAYVFVYDITDD